MSVRSAHEVDVELRSALHDYHRAEQRSVLCFAEVVERRLYCDLGYGTIFEYAAEALGFSRQRTYGFLRMAEGIQRLPELRAALAAGEIGWTKAREVIKVAGPKSAAKWIAVAKRVPRRELEGRVVRARQRRAVARKANPAQGELAPKSPRVQHAALPDLPDESPEPVTFRLSPVQLARYEALIEKLHKQRAVPPGSSREEILLAGLEGLVASAGTELLPRGNNGTSCKIVISECPSCKRARVETHRGPKAIAKHELAVLKCDAILQDERARQRHTIPPRIRHAVLERDQYRCQTPGCPNTRFLEIHHIRPRRNGGANELGNLLTLCSRCHRRVHAPHQNMALISPQVDEETGVCPHPTGQAPMRSHSEPGAQGEFS